MSSIALVCLLAALGTGAAQEKPTSSGPSQARKMLSDKAHTLETRGRPDMAIQLWQQILLSDPNNAEALAGLGRDYKLSGQIDLANEALARLRKVNPNDSNIPKIEALTSTRVQTDQLRQAGDLAKQGKPDEAMRIYRGLFGDHPPDGDIALAFYDTMYGTASGKDQAIAGMRALAQRNPGDTRYSIALGRMLTYRAGTRAEGIRILHGFPRDGGAQAALRQALIWDSANPASAAELRQYVREHPQDTEIANDLREDEGKLAQMNSGIARTPAEQEAFAALSDKKLEEAQKLFTALLEKDPKNGRASAGMGFLRMQQTNFGGAISYLEQAEQSGFKDATVENALSTSRFWFTMGEAAQALSEDRLDDAAAKYREALAMRPRSTEALSGLAGLYVKQQQFSAAADIYAQLVQAEPGNADVWRGLFLAFARQNENEKALAVAAELPAAAKAKLDKDPEFLRTLAAVDRALNRSEDAQRVLAQALALPFPNGGANLKTETRLEFASILMEANRFDQAAEMYTLIVKEDASNLSAWMGLVSAEHELQRDGDAIAIVERMPPATYEEILSDPGFLSMLGSIYQQSGQLEIAQGLLERGAKNAIAAGKQPAVNLQMQLAAIYLARNNTAQAYGLYHQVLVAHPDRVDGWKGLIATLQATGHIAGALQEIALIPPAVRKQLDTDVEFVQTESSLYAANNDYPSATTYLNRVINYYAMTRTTPPSNVEIQNAWLLFNLRNDRDLYPALLRLGSRRDLTIAQRETVENIWAQWSVRRAENAIDDGNGQRGKDILDATFQAFPDNMSVRRAVAGGYLRAGRSRDALTIFKSIPMDGATAIEYEGAIGAALAASDLAQAETWLRQALDRYTADAGVLSIAARFEQARGNNQRAAEYWRASLAAMPAVTPANKLAHELAYPDQPLGVKRANTPADLARLLNPENDPFPRTSKLPPLPAYGPDPYEGTAPAVQSAPVAPVQQRPLWDSVPTPSAAPIPASPVSTYVPQTAPLRQFGAAQLPVSDGIGTELADVEQAAIHAGQPAVMPYVPPMQIADAAQAEPERKRETVADVYIPAATPQVDASAPERPRTVAGVPAQSEAPIAIETAEEHVDAGPTPEEAVRASEVAAAEAAVKDAVAVAEAAKAEAGAASARLSALRDAAIAKTAPMEAQSAELHASDLDTSIGAQTQELARMDLPVESIPLVRELTNAAVVQPERSMGSPESSVSLAVVDSAAGNYNEAQYTPSAQEAASGAYSAPKQQPAQSQPPAAQQPGAPATDTSATPAAKHNKPLHLKAPATAPLTVPAAAVGVPTLASAPGTPAVPEPIAAQPMLSASQAAEAPAPQQAPPITTTGITDQQLQDRNLPPLRGSWVRVEREQRPKSPQDEAQAQLQSIESGYTPWLGGTGLLNYRSGNLGYDHLSALESPFETSMPFGYTGRFTVIAKPVFLDSGQADGSATIGVQESTTAGTAIVNIPEPLGTDVNTGVPSTSTGTTTPTLEVPSQQNSAGVGGEVQLAFPNFAVAGGYTPAGFLVENVTGRLNWRPNAGPFTITFERQPIRDSQLSYAGLRDPGGTTLGHAGQVWGGVVANQGNVQYSRGDAVSGFYLTGGGQYIRGTNVLSNNRADAGGGAYWRVLSQPELGDLSIGVNFFAMHYGNNQLAYTFGMGGYFSPQSYFLANVPFTWAAHSGPKWHYNVLGSFGVQAFQEDSEPLWPLAVDKALEIAQKSAALPAKTSVGPNYDLRAQTAYAISPNWFAGGFLGANNARNYTSAQVGFYIRYMFRPQVNAVTGPTGIFPTDGFRPFRVP